MAYSLNEHNGEEIVERVSASLSKPAALTPLILLMGFIGASLRYILEAAFPAGGGFPWATLAVNIFGCFVLEIINQYVGRRLHLPAPLVKSLGVGLIGAFTTIAAFSTECVGFLNAGRYAMAAFYIDATMITTFVSALVGREASQYLSYRRLQRLRRRHAKRLRARKAEGEAANNPSGNHPNSKSFASAIDGSDKRNDDGGDAQ